MDEFDDMRASYDECDSAEEMMYVDYDYYMNTGEDIYGEFDSEEDEEDEEDDD